MADSIWSFLPDVSDSAYCMTDDEQALAHCEALQGVLSAACSNRLPAVAHRQQEPASSLNANVAQLIFVLVSGVRTGHVRAFCSLSTAVLSCTSSHDNRSAQAARGVCGALV